jgi:hypothetical protein
MTIVHVGIDLAKNVFAMHGVDEHGKPTLVRPAVPRARLHELVACLPPCTVAMEACSGGVVRISVCEAGMRLVHGGGRRLRRTTDAVGKSVEHVTRRFV